MAHSPGDWRLKPGVKGAPIVETDEREIAKVLYHGGSEDHEVLDNARLIAAAPKLLEAAEFAVNWLPLGSALDYLRLAIAKAREGDRGG